MYYNNTYSLLMRPLPPSIYYEKGAFEVLFDDSPFLVKMGIFKFFENIYIRRKGHLKFFL
jgi:hypothetical protein